MPFSAAVPCDRGCNGSKRTRKKEENKQGRKEKKNGSLNEHRTCSKE